MSIDMLSDYTLEKWQAVAEREIRQSGVLGSIGSIVVHEVDFTIIAEVDDATAIVSTAAYRSERQYLGTDDTATLPRPRPI